MYDTNLIYKFSYDKKIIFRGDIFLKLPVELRELIFINYKNMYKYQKKWIKIYNRMAFSFYTIVNELHLFHNYGHKITRISHKLFLHNYYTQGKQLINLSQKIHFLISLLIKDCIKYCK